MEKINNLEEILELAKNIGIKKNILDKIKKSDDKIEEKINKIKNRINIIVEDEELDITKYIKNNEDLNIIKKEEEDDDYSETFKNIFDSSFIYFKNKPKKFLKILYNSELKNILKNLGDSDVDNIILMTTYIEDKRKIRLSLINEILKYDINDVYKYFKEEIGETDLIILDANEILSLMSKEFKKNEKIIYEENKNKEDMIKYNDYIKYINDYFEKLRIILKDGNYVLKYKITENGEVSYGYYSLNSIENINKIKNLYLAGFNTTTINRDGPPTYSDANVSESFLKYGKLTIEKRKMGEKDTNRAAFGGFFNKINITNFNLKKYQIYNKLDIEEFEKIKKNNVKQLIPINENCLYIAIYTSLIILMNKKVGNKYYENIIMDKIKKLKMFVFYGNIGYELLMKIAKDLDIYIVKSFYNKLGKLCYGRYGNKNSNEKINIAIYNNHYFINDEIEIQTMAANYWKEFLDKPKNEKIYKLIYDGEKFYKIQYNDVFKTKALAIIRLLDEKGAFIYDSKLSTFDLYEECDEIFNFDNLLYKKNEVKKIIEKNKIIFAADFETTTKGNNHEAYLVSFSNLNDEKMISYFNDYYIDGKIKKTCSKKFVDYMYDFAEKNKDSKILIYFHNLKYDMRFLFEDITITKLTMKDGIIYSFRSIANLYFVDSYKIIPKKLMEFVSCFKLDKKEFTKEVMPYDFYTNVSVFENDGDINNALSYIKKNREKDIFLKNINELNMISNNNEKRFKHMEYAKYYCERDVKILKLGLIKMEEYLDTLVDDIFVDNLYNEDGYKKTMSIFNYTTISSLADDLLKRSGCYNDVYQLSGDYASFIRKCIDGGTVCSEYNKKIKIIKFLNDFDACSLYPSAMNRIEGFTKGLPKKLELNQLNKDYLDTVTDYFIKINIIKVGNKWGISNIYSKNDGVKNFHNNPCEMFVGKIKFEDLIKFQNIEYEIIEGIYFNEGFNPKIKNVMKIMYDKRVEYKKVNNPVQELFKLMMNSAYGKTILKSSDHTLKCVNKNKFENFQMNNYNRILSFEEFRYFYVVKIKKSTRDHYCSPHIGVNVLDMSKRIMNEVISCAYKNNIRIFYRDTDSMHILDEDINKLSECFKKEYNRELIGEDMGQFHNDFNMKIKGDYKLENIKSVAFICVGKKFYLDLLVGDKYILKEYVGKEYDFHIRSKGISDKCIKNKCKKSGISVIDLYEKLFDGESYNFDLCDGKLMFKYEGKKVLTRKDFYREVSFKNDDKLELIDDNINIKNIKEIILNKKN